MGLGSGRFTRKNDGFSCESCGLSVPPAQGTCRNHCPHCLISKHVDEFPGDRQNTCKSLMDPVGYELEKGTEVILIYRCRGCGFRGRNRAAPDDSYDKILALSGG